MARQQDDGAMVGVDIGGTKISAALIVDDVIVSQARRSTPLTGARDLLAAVSALVSEVDPAHRANGIGVATAGTVDDRGVIASATNLLPGWAGTDVRGYIESAFNVRVRVINDVHGLAVSEARGAPERLLAIALGTGVGGGFAVDGRLVAGPRGWAGSLGHVTVNPSSRSVCSCGARGHLEAEVAGPILERAYATATGVSLPLHAVAGRAHEGDSTARELIVRAGRITGVAAASGVTLLDIDRIVVGGGVAEIGDMLIDAIRAGLDEALPSALRGTVRLDAARSGVRAAMIGAAWHARADNITQ